MSHLDRRWFSNKPVYNQLFVGDSVLLTEIAEFGAFYNETQCLRAKKPNKLKKSNYKPV